MLYFYLSGFFPSGLSRPFYENSWYCMSGVFADQDVLPNACQSVSKLWKQTLETFLSVARRLTRGWWYCCKVAERVLSFWANEYIAAMISDNIVVVLPILYPALFEMSKSHWNQQIVQLSQSVLRYLHDVNRTLYDEVATKHRQNVAK